MCQGNVPNCRLMHSLSFCDKVAYSVPLPSSVVGNNGSMNAVSFEEIKSTYDGIAQARYNNFSSALSRFDCERWKYSLVANCSECDKAYKDWVCTLSIPRCLSHPDSNPLIDSGNLLQRDGGQGNATTALHRLPTNISQDIGTYTEVLPCQDLCWALPQSCPAFFKFYCPLENVLSNGYGTGRSCRGAGWSARFVTSDAHSVSIPLQLPFLVLLLCFVLHCRFLSS
jgi:hypothetical protein